MDDKEVNSKHEERENELVSINSDNEFEFSELKNDAEICVDDLVGGGLVSEDMNEKFHEEEKNDCND